MHVKPVYNLLLIVPMGVLEIPCSTNQATRLESTGFTPLQHESPVYKIYFTVAVCIWDIRHTAL